MAKPKTLIELRARVFEQYAKTTIAMFLLRHVYPVRQVVPHEADTHDVNALLNRMLIQSVRLINFNFKKKLNAKHFQSLLDNFHSMAFSIDDTQYVAKCAEVAADEQMTLPAWQKAMVKAKAYGKHLETLHDEIFRSALLISNRKNRRLEGAEDAKLIRDIESMLTALEAAEARVDDVMLAPLDPAAPTYGSFKNKAGRKKKAFDKQYLLEAGSRQAYITDARAQLANLKLLANVNSKQPSTNMGTVVSPRPTKQSTGLFAWFFKKHPILTGIALLGLLVLAAAAIIALVNPVGAAVAGAGIVGKFIVSNLLKLAIATAIAVAVTEFVGTLVNWFRGRRSRRINPLHRRGGDSFRVEDTPFQYGDGATPVDAAALEIATVAESCRDFLVHLSSSPEGLHKQHTMPRSPVQIVQAFKAWREDLDLSTLDESRTPFFYASMNEHGAPLQRDDDLKIASEAAPQQATAEEILNLTEYALLRRQAAYQIKMFLDGTTTLDAGFLPALTYLESELSRLFHAPTVNPAEVVLCFTYDFRAERTDHFQWPEGIATCDFRQGGTIAEICSSLRTALQGHVAVAEDTLAHGQGSVEAVPVVGGQPPPSLPPMLPVGDETPRQKAARRAAREAWDAGQQPQPQPQPQGGVYPAPTSAHAALMKEAQTPLQRSQAAASAQQAALREARSMQTNDTQPAAPLPPPLLHTPAAMSNTQ